MRIRELKASVAALMQGTDLDQILEAVNGFPREQVLNPLFSCLCSCDEVIKWHAVTAIGQVVAGMAEADLESARIVMRRFMWMLNDESGGIGWGVPEAIGEVCATHPQIAQEYAHILVSFMREDGFYLELPQLQRGLMWALARFAQDNSQLLKEKNALVYLSPYLSSRDVYVKAHGVLASGYLRAKQFKADIEAMAADEHLLTMYVDRRFVETSLGALATDTLSQLQ